MSDSTTRSFAELAAWCDQIEARLAACMEAIAQSVERESHAVKELRVLQERLAKSEAMTIALAWTHPNRALLEERLLHWLESGKAQIRDPAQAVLAENAKLATLAFWNGIFQSDASPLPPRPKSDSP